ncbi:hypothetical protein AVEN_274913-1 [Araneus ventricosus]|uniref:Uncharacterized protein n=1 Tax=Araneus ventricosus TaxID=182803 RepID=A0A4Y2JWF1_ARAVE|nr:hypothetical protein AVEN_274913-1 [Araneus ventricosus]
MVRLLLYPFPAFLRLVYVREATLFRAFLLAVEQDQSLLYPTCRTVTREKRTDMIDLLKFIPPIKHDYYKNLQTNRHDGSLNTTDEEDINYITD